MTARLCNWCMVTAVVLTLALPPSTLGADANIALGRPYAFSRPPDYGYCTDDGDSTDLTDGKRVAAEDVGFWTDKGCVGWGNGATGLTITIDLGRVEPISGVAYCAAAGSSDVTWPHAIHVFVSDDGDTYFRSGELFRLTTDDLPPPYGTYAVRRLAASSLRTFGRYVRFFVAPFPSYIFVDEIEVHRGAAELLRTDRGPPVTTDEVLSPAALTQQGSYLRIRRDVETLRRMLGKRTAVDAATLAELSAVRRELQETDFPLDPLTFRAVLPLNDLHSRVLATFGRLLSSTPDHARMIVWHTPPYEPIDLFAAPVGDHPDLRLKMMSGERRAETINLTNASGIARDLAVTVTGLPEGAGLRPLQVEYVGLADGRVSATALVPLARRGAAYTTRVPAGMTRQLWLCFEPAGLEPGDHRGRITIAGDDLVGSIAVTLSISPRTFPGRTDYGLGMWDYIFDEGWGIDPGNREAAHAHVMDDPLINTVWAAAESLPAPRGVGPRGDLEGAIDFTRWDRFVRFWPGKSHYFAFARFSPDQPFLGLDRNSRGFRRAVTQWARRWAEHNREALGLSPRQTDILFIDEPAGSTWLQATWQYADAFRKGTDEILVFNDPSVLHLHEDFGPELVGASDIICVDPQQFERASGPVRRRLSLLSGEGKQLWFYRALGPIRGYDPSYYRLQPWHSRRDGSTGGSFWAYHPPEHASSWNEYALGGRKNFTPLFIDGTSVTSSKQYEAMREGVMDWQYMQMLGDRVAELEKAGRTGPRLDAARELLDDLPKTLLQRVTDRYSRLYYYEWGTQCTMAEAARLQVLEALEGLDALDPRP